MKISDEAVEAAAKALYADVADGDPWDDADFDDVSEVMQMALNMLEAAAPHLMAAALMSAAKEARIRGGVGKEDKGGIAAWDFLEWRAQLALRLTEAGE